VQELAHIKPLYPGKVLYLHGADAVRKVRYLCDEGSLGPGFRILSVVGRMPYSRMEARLKVRASMLYDNEDDAVLVFLGDE